MESNVINVNNIPKKTPKKKFIIPAIIGVAVLAIVAIVVVVIINSNPSYEYTGGVYEITYEKSDDYSEMLNIYNNLWNEMTEERMMEMLEKGEIDKNYVQINKESGESFIAATPIESGVDYLGQEIEFISFTYLPGDDELTVSMIDDVTYHHYHDGIHEFIQESSDGVFMHYDDGLTNEYDDKTSAIDSYLMQFDIEE